MAFNKMNVALVSLVSSAVSDGDTKKEMMHHSKTKRVETLKDSCCSKLDGEHLIQIFVNNCLMAPICLQQHPSTTIFTLKGILQDKLGIQPEKQQLSTLKGIVLCDDLSLEDQNIRQDANLELNTGPGLLGGTRKRRSRGTPNRNRQVAPSRETTPQVNQSERKQSNAAAGFFLVWILALWTSIRNWIVTRIQHVTRNQHVMNINASRGPVFTGPANNITINYNAPRTNRENDETDTTTNPQRQSDAADKCEEELKARYTSKDSKVQMNPLLKKMHILDIYTDLVLESHDEEGGPQEGRKNLKSYEEVFTIETREGNLINRTVFEGKAGLGKSTLISKIVYDWANELSKVLQKYKLVFSLKMHALEETSDFIKAIFNQLLAEDTSVDETDLQSYIKANPENVLILLDGFDEFMTTILDQAKFGSVLKIVSQKMLGKCCVVVTTRPSQYHTLRTELMQDTMNRVKVLGFRKEDIEKYVKQVYSKEIEKAKELLQKIQSSNVLSELVKSPMLLLMVCALWQESSSLPETLSLLYKDALNYLFRRRKGKKVITVKEISRTVNEIGKSALDGLLSKIQKLSFAEKLFETGALVSALAAGILTSQKVLEGLELQNSIQFLHKTMQEFCAGLFLQNLQKENFDEFQKILGQIKGMRNLSNLDYLLRFCCGGNDECTNAVLAILKEKCPDDHRLALNCYFENQSKEPPTEDFINLVVTEEVCIKQYDEDSLNSFAYFLNCVVGTKRNKGAVFLGKVNEVVLHSCNLQKSFHKLLHLMCNMHNLSVLNFQYCQGLGGSGSLWAPLMGKMQKLGKLSLQYCQLNDNDVQHVAAIVTLVSLDLSHNRHLGGKAELWAPCLEKMDNLKKLKLRDCSLVGKDVKFLACMVRLITLQLSGNVELRHSISEWSKCLYCLKNLTKLRMNDCNIATEDLKFIAQSCIDLSSLVNCSVDNNVHPEMNYQLKISDGTTLLIRGCSVSNANLEDILKVMSKRTELKELSLSEFEKFVHSDIAWCAQLQQFKLERLVFSNFGLKGTTIQCLVKQLEGMPDLAELYLNGNTDLKGSAEIWFPFLSRLVPLKKLVLQDCKLTKDDWEYIKTYSNCEVDNCIVCFE